MFRGALGVFCLGLSVTLVAANVPAELHLAYTGLSPVTGFPTIGELALDAINNDTSLLPNTTLKMTVIDSKCNPANLIYPVMNLTCAIQTTDCMKVVVWIGAACSEVSMQIAQLLPFFKVPQVSYVSTSSELSDKTYFPYFIRTIGPNNNQARGVVSLMVHFNWTKAGTFSTSDTKCKVGIQLFAEYFRAKGGQILMEVTAARGITPSDSSLLDAVSQIPSSGARILVNYARAWDAKAYYEACVSYGVTGKPYVHVGFEQGYEFYNEQYHPPSNIWNDMFGTLGIGYYTGSNTGQNALWKAKMVSLGVDPETMAIYYQWDTFMTVATVLHRMIEAGENVYDGELTLARLWAFTGPSWSDTGDIAFDENGDRHAPFIVQIVGKGSLIDLGRVEKAADGNWTYITSEDPVFHEGVSGIPSDSPPVCEAGRFADSTSESCVSCPPGKYSQQGALTCIDCLQGRYGDSAGQSNCLSCSPGSFASHPGATQCEECSAGNFTSDVQSSACMLCPLGKSSVLGSTECLPCETGKYASTEGTPSCESCPSGRVSIGLGLVDPALCLCDVGTYSKDSAEDCQWCSALKTTEGPGAMSPDECIFDATFYIVLIVPLATIVLILITGFFMVKYLRAYKRRVEVERENILEDKVKTGITSVTNLSHPMVLTHAIDFLSMTEEQARYCYEGLRRKGKLFFLDSKGDVDTLKRCGYNILFFSYQWLSWTKKGPNTAQWKWMKAAIPLYCEKNDIAIDKIYVWLDIFSIPQNHDACKLLAVNSLYTYASCADALIVIAPDSRHEHTDEEASLESYLSRVWCRVEQVAHLASSDLESMYVMKGDRLELVSNDWIRKVVRIFDGEMTCCRLKHKYGPTCDRETLVLPLLGLWSSICACEDEQKGQALAQVIREDRDGVFPKTFNFVQEKGSKGDVMEQRTLFGDLIGRVEQHATGDNKVAKTISNIKKTISDAHPASHGQPGAEDKEWEPGNPNSVMIHWDGMNI